nr:SUMF1/EgtB/PvdO family nonheme iron enzyme [Tychonema sp. LEGE 07203]
MGLLARINPLQYRWGRQAKRGGSWNNNPRNCRSAYRNNNNPDNRNNNIGFRVARSAPRTLYPFARLAERSLAPVGGAGSRRFCTFALYFFRLTADRILALSINVLF